MAGIITFPDETPEDDSAAVEQRKFKRKPVLYGARLETSTGAYDCITLDLSLGGAKLRLSAVVDIPKQPVVLVLDRFGVLQAEIAWQRPGLIGLRFTEEPDYVVGILGRTLPL
jgi:hypothetical protein